MEERSHGGNIYEVSKRFKLNHREILDFSANINPLGFPDSVRRIIWEKIDDIIHYPDPGQVELREAASVYYGIKPENILSGNGSVELINLTLEALRPSKVIIPSPTFTEYAFASQNRRIKTELVDMTKNDFYWDDDFVESIKARICPGALVIVCNPNNPTGYLIVKDVIKTLIDETERAKAFLLLDEAFMDFVGESQSLCTEVMSCPNVIVLRSLTKFFALPGLRIGFALGNEKLIKKIEKLKDPWNVNTFAGAVGSAVLKETAYIEKTRKYISQEREFLWDGLRQISCFKPFRPAANFIFVKITAKFGAGFLARELLKRGIAIRECGDFAFLDDSYFRVAVKDRKANETLLEALREITAASGLA
ncbi:threonine-phosphate decarboxylase CobD [Thermosediminibacter litoriperuensis]|uniref:threonine-phosphate decarboxylase n=1 Tax=Thermosediminibacter litoriperuensis TaxID=291989 RepID=A0A5S5AWN2_9FIRM|nr:threonine-phosphate decarboxylase CobD [Thermosediminibacter litoriperuensis]TYP56795.1 L-threonine O-3-phosphate decarboxylase [Thermosediminibacter litoriperuensis]